VQPHSVHKLDPKNKPPPIFQKIVLKIANEIRFLEFLREVIV